MSDAALALGLRKACQAFAQALDGIPDARLDALVETLRTETVIGLELMQRADRLEAERLRQGQVDVVLAARRLAELTRELWPEDPARD